MTNIASALKAEISRIARKEVRAETAPVRKSSGGHRSELAALKRRVQGLELALGRLRKAAPPSPQADRDETSSGAHRFSAKRLAAHRRRLALSAGDFGLLIGVSAQSIYNWEAGKARPRAGHMPAIAALRTLGRRRAMAHLESLAARG